eukprot:jgi/Bigna1/126361/aug1.2_g1069
MLNPAHINRLRGKGYLSFREAKRRWKNGLFPRVSTLRQAFYPNHEQNSSGPSLPPMHPAGQGLPLSTRSILKDVKHVREGKEDDLSLSYDELREKLYERFHNEGVIKSLKSQLRSQVLGKLRGDPLYSAINVREQKPLTILQRAIHSLVAEFLHCREYHQTLSVFLPECATELPSKEKGHGYGLTFEDAINTLNLRPNKAFIEAFANRPEKQGEKAESSTQTAPNLFNPDIDTVDWKLKKLEEKYRSDLEKDAAMPYLTMEERMQKYQRDCDKRARTEIEQEIRRIRSTEIAQVRIEERMRYRQELEVPSEGEMKNT